MVGLQRARAALREELDRRDQKFKEWQKKYNIDKNGQISLEDLSRMFFDHNKSKIIGKLFGRVVEVAKQIGLEIKFDGYLNAAGTSNYAGRIRYNTGNITSSGFNNQDVAALILHELIHSVTQSTVSAQKSGGKYAEHLTESQKKAAQQIIDVFNELKKWAEKNGHKDTYGFKSPHEMLAEMAKLNFRNILKSIKTKEKKTLWEIIKDAFHGIFSLTKETDAEKRVAGALDDLIENFSMDTFNDTKDYNVKEQWNTIGATSTPEEILTEEAKVDTNPTEAQKEAGNYQKGHIKVDGYDITIENPKGSVRRGTDKNGNAWEQVMNNTYGYIRGTEAVDGDHIDVFLSDDPTSGNVYVVDQVDPETGEFDESKVMYSFGSEEEAREAYLSNYEKGWKGLGNITEVSREDFKKWIESSHRKTKPFAEYKSVKHKVEQQMKNFDTALKQLNTRGISIDNQELLDKYGLRNVVLSKTGDHLTLTHFIVDQQGQGYGTRFMEDLARLADEKGWTLALTPGLGFGAKSKKKLEEFYKRFGFVANKGRNADFQTREAMIRRPKEFMEKPENQEKVIRDAVVEYLKSIGIDVSTDWKLGQRILDEHNRRLEANEESEEQIKSQKATTIDISDGNAMSVDMRKPIEETIPRDPKINEALNIKDRVDNMTPEELIENYKRINSQMLDENGLNVDELEDIRRREYISKHAVDKGFGKAMADHLKMLSDKYGYGKLCLRWDLLDRIKELGLEDYLGDDKPYVTEKDTAKVYDMHGRPKLFKTSDGYAYGYTYKGKIYVDPRIATAETPIHEYDHLWCEMKRQTAPEEWNEIKQVMLNDEVVKPIIDRVKRDYEELTKEGREDDFVEEVITQFSGKRGAERLREVAEEVAKENGGIFGKAEAITAMQRLKSILNQFWEGVAKMMGWKYRNANQIADRMMSDMLNGVDPTKIMKDAVSRRDDIMSQMVGKMGAAEADKAKEETIRMDNNRMAEEMEKAGKDAKVIKLATGWERGADGQWRYEIPDANVDIISKFNDKVAEMKANGVESPEPILKLGELLGEENDLFKYYPKMKDMQVLFSKGLSDGTAGAYDHGTIELNINETNRFDGDDLNNENVYGTLLHEVQHAIQDIEGFAKGGNLYTSTTDEGINAIIEKKEKQINDLKTKWWANNKILDNPEELEAAAELDGKSVKEVKDELSEKVIMQAAEIDTLNLQIARLKHTKSPARSDATDLYNRLAGEVESRNVTERMNMSEEERRNSLASETEDIPREDQVIINDSDSSGSIKDIETVNTNFNSELQKQIDHGFEKGGIDKNHVYKLGKPSEALKYAGVEDLPLEITARKLKEKSDESYKSNHPYDLKDVIDLPKSIQRPIAVFESDTYPGRKVVLTELKDKKGHNFIAAIDILRSRGRNIVEFNSIISLYPKDSNGRIAKWFDSEFSGLTKKGEDPLLKWADTKKASIWLANHASDVHAVGLSSKRIAKIIQNFESAQDFSKKMLNASQKDQENDNNSLKYQKVEDDTHSDNKIDSPETGRPRYQNGEDALHYAERLAEYERQKKMGSPEEAPVNMAQQIYEDAIRDTGERMMIPAMVASIFNKETRERFKHKFAESWFDYSRSIKALQDAIEKATGNTIQGFEDVWRTLNAKSSIDNDQIQKVMHNLIEPLSEFVGNMVKDKEIDGHRMTIDDVEKYMNAVHGIERNIGMAKKQARDEYEENIAMQKQQLESGELKGKERKSVEDALLIKEARFKGIKNYMDNEVVAKWYSQWNRSLENARTNGTITDEEYNKARKEMDAEYENGWQYKYRNKDYSGLTALFADDFKDKKPTEDQLEQAAKDYADRFEKIVGKKSADGLWQRVKALNEWSLRKSYESGLISRDQMNDTLSMYRHYIPLRGWHDDYAGDVYQYISRGEPAEVLQGVLKKAYGRKSRAARIFGTMAAMANTAIVQGNKNLVAQHLLNMALNHRDAGLLMPSEQYYQKNADGQMVPQMPALNDNMTPEEMRQELERFEAEMKAKEDAGEVQTLRSKFRKEFPLHMAKWQEQRHAVRVMRNGKEYMVYILGNPRAAEAFNGLLNPNSQPGAISNVVNMWNRWLAKWQTSLSPEFLFSNFQRDVMTATTGAYIKYGNDYKRQFEKNILSVMPLTKATLKKLKGEEAKNLGGIFSLFRKYDSGTLDMNDETERLFKEFVEGGGMTGISHITKEYQDSMEKMVRRMRQGKMGKVRKGWEAVGDGIEFLNKGIENATRFATYMTSRQQGRTIRESIFDAKEASVNFNMKGSGAWGNMMARRLYLYVNPAMQALRMLGTWYENDPVVASKEGGKMVAKAVGKRFLKTAAGVITASVTCAIVNKLLSELLHGADGDDDDKDKGDWWALSEWNRYNYINVINPFGKGYFHWSIPQELRPLWAMGQIAVDMAFGRKTWQRGLQSMVLQLNNLSPLSFFEGGTDGGETVIESELRTMTPSFLAPFFDAYFWNRDFMGHKITNRTGFNKEDPEWQRAGEDTPKAVVNASRKLNNITGGADNSRGWLEDNILGGTTNPSALYYLATQQFGGVGSMTKRLLNLIDQAADDEKEVEMRNIPFVPKVYVSTGDDHSKQRVLNDKFWTYYNEYKAADHEIKKNKKDVEAKEMTQEYADKRIEERKADGTYNTWKIFEDNDFEYILDNLRGSKYEDDVKRMVVDAIENGRMPDYEAMLSDPNRNTDNDGLFYKVRMRQIKHKVDDMKPDEAFEEFDKTDDPRMRKELAKRISKDAGASEDPYGDKPSSDHAYQYQIQRTAEDVREDALLYALQEQLRNDDKEREKDELSKERKKAHSSFEFLHGGRSDVKFMDNIREERKRLMKKYGLLKEEK